MPLEKTYPPIQIAFTHKNCLHTIRNNNKYTSRQHINLGSRDTASRDAFPSGFLAMPTARFQKRLVTDVYTE